MSKKEKKKGTLKYIIIIILLLFVIAFFSSLIIIPKLIKIDIGEKSEKIKFNQEYKINKGKATLFGNKINIKHKGKINNKKLGKNKIKYTASFLIYKKNTTKIVDVIDEEKPQITLNGNEEITIYLNEEYKDSGATASDEYDGDLTSKIQTTGEVDTKTIGKYEITYTVKDSSNNESQIKRTVIVKENDNRNIIYLTFDDGPNDTYTPKVLDLLKKYDAKATFFVTGYGNDEFIKREYDEGHTVALHTFTHNYSIYSSIDTYFDDLNKVEDRVFRITGEHSKIIRFPGGSSNTVSKKYNIGIMTTLTKMVEEKGYQYYDWNISSGDAGNTTDPNVVYQNVISGIGPDKLNIVLLHDRTSHTYEALEPILQWGKSNGYRFMAITSSTKPVHHGVNN